MHLLAQIRAKRNINYDDAKQVFGLKMRETVNQVIFENCVESLNAMFCDQQLT
jgi:hypothetical protein